MPTQTSASTGASSGPPSGKLMSPPPVPDPPCPPPPVPPEPDVVAVPVDALEAVSPLLPQAETATINETSRGAAQRRCTAIETSRRDHARTNRRLSRRRGGLVYCARTQRGISCGPG